MLNSRQQRTYIYRVDLFPPEPLTVESDQAARDLYYPPLPKYRLVPCFKGESAEMNVPTLAGRTNYDISLTLDMFKFEASQEIEDGWLIRVHPRQYAPPDRAEFEYYVTQGGGRDNPTIPGTARRANQRRVFAVKTIAPRTVDGGETLLVSRPTGTEFGGNFAPNAYGVTY